MPLLLLIGDLSNVAHAFVEKSPELSQIDNRLN